MRNRITNKGIFLSTVLAAVLLFLLIFIGYYNFQLNNSAQGSSKPVGVTINQGENTFEIADTLKSKNLIGSKIVFITYLLIHRLNGSIQAGDYQLAPNQTMKEVLSHITKGKVRVNKVTIIEGESGKDIIQKLAENGLSNMDELQFEFENGDFKYDFLDSKPAGRSVEGFLFPDTYNFRPNSQAYVLLQSLLENFDRKVDPKLREKLTSRGLNLYEAITLASIVEREAKFDQDRKPIAEVYYKRLSMNMLLQADATIVYETGNNKLTQADLEKDTPYNTYRYKGLPPTPIGNPGLASIKAVSEAGDTEFLYYINKADGQAVFAKTAEEHQKNVDKYLNR